MARPTDRSKRAYADANVFLALFAGADHVSNAAATALFTLVAQRELRLTVMPLVVAEVVWATQRAFGWKPVVAATALLDVLDTDGLEVMERATVVAALDLQIADPRLDFVDAYLAAAALTLGPATVASFDGDSDRVAGIERMGG